MSATRDGAPDQPEGWTPGDLLDRQASGVPAERGVRLRELVREWLPLGLRDGRIDLGARAAAALSVLALLAAAVALLLVWRSAARPVAAPSPAAGVKVAIPAPAGESGAVPVTPTSPGAVAPSPAAVLVEVAGKVRRPGVVKVSAGARVNDAIAAAGGLQPGATTDGLALARRLVDGEQIVVGLPPPAGGLPAASPSAPVTGAGGTGGGGGDGQPVDLNAATVADLDALPGIGPVLAERMIAWRDEHGGFSSVEQLREVSGVGDKKYEALAELVRV